MQPDPGSYVREAPAMQRIGLKGKGVSALLASRGLTAPASANSWQSCTFQEADDGRLLRLGFGEYLLEHRASGSGVAILSTLFANLPPECHALVRDDREFIVGGEGCEALLAEICNVDFAALDVDARGVVLTLMAGVAVTVIKQPEPAVHYRIWCDPSFGHYLWSVLRRVLPESHNEDPT